MDTLKNHSAMSSSLSKTSHLRVYEGCVRGSHQHKRGLWTEEEDKVLSKYIAVHGKGHWNRIAKNTGLNRCGKSCRLRWINYLSPDVKKGNFSEQEDDLIIRLHKLLGNRWSLIAGRIPGRTDNQVKNYWNTHLSKLGCGQRQRTESCFPSPDTNSKYTEALIMTPTPLENTKASFSRTGDDDFFANDPNSGTRRDELKQEKSMFHSLARFSDEFLEHEFDWNNNLSSIFFD